MTGTGSDETISGRFEPPLVNIGTGTDLTIKELAAAVRDVVAFSGEVAFDTSKPDGTPRKLMNVDRLVAMGWTPQTQLSQGLLSAYGDYVRQTVS